MCTQLVHWAQSPCPRLSLPGLAPGAVQHGPHHHRGEDSIQTTV